MATALGQMTTAGRGFLDSATPYVLTGGLLALLAVGAVLGSVMLMATGGVALVSVGLAGVSIGGWFGVHAVGTVRHGLELRSGAAVHEGLGRSAFGSRDWKELLAGVAGIVVAAIVIGALAVTAIPALGNVIPVAVIAGIVMTGFAHSDYLQEIRGVPKQAAVVAGWVTALVMAVLVLPLLVGAANAMRLGTKYDL